MEPYPSSDKSSTSAVIDTGQSAPVAASALADSVQLSAGEGLVKSEDGSKDQITPCYQTLETSPDQGDGTSLPVLSEDDCVSAEDNSYAGEDDVKSFATDGQVSAENSDHSGKLGGSREDCVKPANSKPKIVIQIEGEESREMDSSNDEDLDPLITVDDTESQSSDLINFDTVSYDVIQQPGVEEDDDERSITTMSSLSCDIKMDSPVKHSQGSNSSSLVNLLDSSLKESSCLAGSPSPQMLVDGALSAASSCPSSPSLRSSENMSSAVDESAAEAFHSVLEANEGYSKIVNDFDTVESEAATHSECDSDLVSHNPSELELLDGSDSSIKHEKCFDATSSSSESDSRNNNLDRVVKVQAVSASESAQSACNSNEICRENMTCDASSASEKILESLIQHQDYEAVIYPAENRVTKNDKEDSVENNEDCSTVTSMVPCYNQDTISPSCDQSSLPPKDDNIPTSISTSTSDEKIFTVSSEDCDLNTPTVSSTSGETTMLVDSHEGSIADSVVSSTTQEKIISLLPNADVAAISADHTSIDEGILLTSTCDRSSPTSVIRPPPNEEVSIEENISSSTASLVCSEENISYSAENIIISEHLGAVEKSEVSQKVRTPSSIDSAVSVSHFMTSEESTQLRSCDSSNDSAELCSLGAMSAVSTEMSFAERSCGIVVEKADSVPQSPTLRSPDKLLQSMTAPHEICENSNSLSFQINADGSSLEEGKLESDPCSANCDFNLVAKESLKTKKSELDCVSSDTRTSISEDQDKMTAVMRDELDKPFVELIKTPSECEQKDCGESSLPTNIDQKKVIEGEDFVNNEKEISKSPTKSQRPTTLPDINSTKSLVEKPCGMNFSDFLGLVNAENLVCSTATRQYNVTALDEAQQIASGLVDNILQTAVLKAEEKLLASKNFVKKQVETVETAHNLVDEILRSASAQVCHASNCMATTTATFDIKNNEDDFLTLHSKLSESKSNEADEGAVTSSGDPCDACANSSVDQTLSGAQSPLCSLEVQNNTPQPDSPLEQQVSSTLPVVDVNGVQEDKPTSESFSREISSSLSNASSEVDLNISDKCSSETLNYSGKNSSSGSLVEVHPKEESARTSFSENGASDSLKSSLLSCSDLGLRSEASLFVDGVLEEAVKRYEESSSSETSPVKIKVLALDSDYTQEEEELATPCGEMLTEHFMDFESGRNVSVFCSLPESGSEDHLMALDRTAHTIGNREVDSDTGKSVSVFRIEEDVYYEIQRPSTCTSVFESVEEEDEDMIDTTVPVEDRPIRTMKTSISLPSFDSDKLEISDSDAFEDAVGAFLAKERSTRNELKRSKVTEIKDITDGEGTGNPCRALVLKHPEYDLSNQEEKRRMAEKWANGGEWEVPDTPEMHEKQRAIREALDSGEDVAVKLCKLALTEGGLINDSLRREAWPRMLGLDPTIEIDAPSLEDLKSHPEYGQVVLDVNRSLKRFPPDIPKDRRETLQDKLTRLIMYVISKHPHLRYYQGYHDVAVTFLLVVGESVAFQIMERLSTEHLSDCMQPTMERTSYLLHFIYPLLHRLHPTLADYLERSEVGTMFCLPWFLTWFGHSLDRYQDVVRLYDHFLASPPLAPLYVAAVLVAHRADEVLAVDCDMAAIHALLSHIPDSLPLEILLRDATDLYLKFPPESIEREVEERFKNEQELRNHEMEARERVQRQRALRRRRGHSHGSGSWQLAEVNHRLGGTMMAVNRWIPPWVVQQQRLSMRLLFASATFFVGFYVYSRGGDMLPYM